MYFIDQLFMQQDHFGEDLPRVGTAIYEKFDLETGEKIKSGIDKKIIEGSYSTVITVRCDGHRVRVEGNPSRWQRKDNLFGYKTIDECVEVFNKVLAFYELPPFTKLTRIFHRANQGDGKRAGMFSDGAEITLIDITRNHEVGEGNEQSFIRGMSSMKIGNAREPKLYPDGNTCNWSEASKWSMTKLYNKGAELRRQLKKATRKNLKNPLPEEEIKHREKLIEFVESRGVVREEHSLRQLLLKRYSLQFYGNNTLAEFLPHIQDLENAMKTISISHDRHLTVAEQLINGGVVDTVRKANTTMNYFTLWQNGVDLTTVIKDTQFKQHKGRLKKIGIDISQKFDVTRMCPTLVRSEVIEVKPLSSPDWYVHATVHETNLLPFTARLAS